MKVETLENISIPKTKNMIFTKPSLQSWGEKVFENIVVNKPDDSVLALRKRILDLAVRYTERLLGCNISAPVNLPVIATGHQCCFAHPGIWVKSVIASKLASSLNSTAIHLVLDHDVCNTQLKLPVKRDKHTIDVEKVSFERTLSPFSVEQRERKGNANSEIQKIIEKFPQSVFVKVIRDVPSHFNLTDTITYFYAVINEYLGVNVLYLPVSVLSRTQEFRDFCDEISDNAKNFANLYNNAVESCDVKLKKLSMADSIEMPFWNIEEGQLRKTVYLYKKINASGFAVRPKAVSLMLFVRAKLADFFIHGVGSQDYEPVTDYLLKNYYDINSINYGIATTTINLPMKVEKLYKPDNPNKLKSSLRELKFNPENYIPQKVKFAEPVRLLIERKKELIKQSTSKDALPVKRSECFEQIKDINKQLSKFTQQLERTLEAQLDIIAAIDKTEKIMESRDFFFGLCPEDFLRDIVSSIDIEMRESVYEKGIGDISAS